MHHGDESVACQNQFFDPSTIPDKDQPDTIWASSTVITSSQVMQTPQPSMAPGSGSDHKTFELTDKNLPLLWVYRMETILFEWHCGEVITRDDSGSPVTTRKLMYEYLICTRKAFNYYTNVCVL